MSSMEADKPKRGRPAKAEPKEDKMEATKAPAPKAEPEPPKRRNLTMERLRDHVGADEAEKMIK